jgi:hypothetical protein
LADSNAVRPVFSLSLFFSSRLSFIFYFFWLL